MTSSILAWGVEINPVVSVIGILLGLVMIAYVVYSKRQRNKNGR